MSGHRKVNPSLTSEQKVQELQNFDPKIRRDHQKNS